MSAYLRIASLNSVVESVEMNLKESIWSQPQLRVVILQLRVLSSENVYETL